MNNPRGILNTMMDQAITMAKSSLIAIMLALVLGTTASSANAQQIGGFDVTRQGSTSFTQGTFYEKARASLLANFPASTFVGTATITPAFLETVRVFVLGSATGCCSAMSPLSESEQQALADFVTNGGTVIMFVDNNTFSTAAPAVHASMLAPFGLAVGGTINGETQARIPDASISPITSGPFGTINSFSEVYPGAFTELGSATAIAFNALGPTLAVLKPGDTIPSGNAIRGRAVFFSECTQFLDDDEWFGQFVVAPHEALLLNVFEFALPIVEVGIDIKPGSVPNNINLGSSGVIPVAILSTADFSAPTEVNPDTIRLAGARVRLVGKSGNQLCHAEDVNTDGLPDLVCQFETTQFLIEEGKSIAVLDGETFDGTRIRGEDRIRITPN